MLMDQRCLEQLLAFYCAPTLAGLKAASLLSICKKKIPNSIKLLAEYRQEMNCKGISFEILLENAQYCLVLVYRREPLQAIFHNGRCMAILQEYGYRNCKNVDAHISHLKQRIHMYKTFPHEIGLFLGYPVEDVVGFIQHKGRHCKLCGYWKVYSNPETARDLFEQYARCIAFFCRHVNKGSSIHELLQAI